MNKESLLRKVRHIEIKSRALSNHICSGEYHRAFKGKGMSFSEVREYQYGDDIKNIDWNVTARFNQAFIKIFEEERELTLMLLIDISPSTFFGTAEQTKNERIAEICAILAFSATANNDKVGAIFFSDTIKKFVHPNKGRSHVLRIIYDLLAFAESEQIQPPKPPNFWQMMQKKPVDTPLPNSTNLHLAIDLLNNAIKKRCTAFILSDFFCNNYEKNLQLAAQKHDIVGIQLTDQHEKQLPQIGIAPMYDSETNTWQWIDTQHPKNQQLYQQYYQQKNDYCTNIFLRSNADLLTITTHHSYITHLIHFFKQRGK